jgi:hypothetical protein
MTFEVDHPLSSLRSLRFNGFVANRPTRLPIIFDLKLG